MECTGESGELVSDDPSLNDVTSPNVTSPNDVNLPQHPQDSMHQPNAQPELPASQVDYLATQASQSDPITQASQSDPITQASQSDPITQDSQQNQQTQVKALQSGQHSGQHNAPVTSDPSAAKSTSSSPSANASCNASSNESSHTSRTRQKSPAFNRTPRSFSAHGRRHSTPRQGGTPRHKTDTDRTVRMFTPDIKTAFKRMEPASSPDQLVNAQGNVQRSDDGIS